MIFNQIDLLHVGVQQIVVVCNTTGNIVGCFIDAFQAKMLRDEATKIRQNIITLTDY